MTDLLYTFFIEWYVIPILSTCPGLRVAVLDLIRQSHQLEEPRQGETGCHREAACRRAIRHPQCPTIMLADHR
jgi:hypothetical protein